MSATDRIREALHAQRPGWADDRWESKVIIPPAEAEALCDLAEFARVLHPHPACPPDCPACAALARLDGEDGDG